LLRFFSKTQSANEVTENRFFSAGLTERLVSALTSPPLSQWNLPMGIFDLLNVEAITAIRGGPTPTTR
jgi:hypothetical protein